MRVPKPVISILAFLFLMPQAAFVGIAQTTAPTNRETPSKIIENGRQSSAVQSKHSETAGLVETPNTPAIDPTQRPDLEVEASPLNFKLSPDGTVASVLFDKESVEGMRTLMSQLEQNGTLGKVKGVVYAASGITPMLILTGEKQELLEKLNLLKQFLPDQDQAHIVVISASLRELADQDAYNIGLTLSPDIIGMTLGGTATAAFQTN
jgi:hypothetical protein